MFGLGMAGPAHCLVNHHSGYRVLLLSSHHHNHRRDLIPVVQLDVRPTPTGNDGEWMLAVGDDAGIVRQSHLRVVSQARPGFSDRPCG